MRTKAGLVLLNPLLVLGLGFATLAHAQPANDNFVNALTLTGPNGSVTGSTIAATKEPGEPDHTRNVGGQSIWFTWQAPKDGIFNFDTLGSSFDTLLGVYTGSSVSSLTLVADDDDIGGGVYQSGVQFVAGAGTTYRIAVDGFNNGITLQSGSVVLSWAPTLEIVTSGPLTKITLGREGSFQVHHADFLSGQVFPPAFAPADAGFFVRQDDGTVAGLDIFNRPTAADNTHAVTFHPISQALSQDGLQVTTVMDNRDDGSPNRFQVTQVTRYRPGDEYFVVENTVLNQGASSFTADYFAAADLYLADSDLGFGFEHASSGVVGGTDTNRVYNIFVQGQPGNPVPVLFQEDNFNSIWQVIGSQGENFANTIRTSYLDNGAGLEWPGVTLAPGASVKIAYHWSFGVPSDLAVSLAASPESPGVGTELTYQAMVTNVGATTVTGVALTDALPGGVSFLSASSSAGSCANQSGTITCNLGTLAPGQSALVTIRVQPAAAGMISNVVAVSANQADIDLFNNTATAQVTAVGAPALSIRTAGPNVVLSWQATCPSCVLQQVDHLNLSNMWLSVGAPVVTVDGTNQVTLPRAMNNRFFRLGPGM